MPNMRLKMTLNFSLLSHMTNQTARTSSRLPIGLTPPTTLVSNPSTESTVSVIFARQTFLTVTTQLDARNASMMNA